MEYEKSALILVETTCATIEEARLLAEILVSEQRVAACCHIYRDVETVYKWEGDLHTGTEVVLRIKSLATALAAICTAIRHHHSYSTPQITVVHCSYIGSAPYEEWVKQQVLSHDVDRGG